MSEFVTAEAAKIPQQDLRLAYREESSQPLSRHFTGSLKALGLSMAFAFSAMPAEAQEKPQQIEHREGFRQMYPGRYIDPTPNDVNDKMSKQMCRVRDGHAGLQNLRFNTQLAHGEKSIFTFLRTTDVDNCDRFGLRTITGIYLRTKGDSQTKWKTSENLFEQEVKGNDGVLVLKDIQLNNTCKPEDSFLEVEQIAKTEYRNYSNNRVTKKVQREPIGFGTVIECE